VQPPSKEKSLSAVIAPPPDDWKILGAAPVRRFAATGGSHGNNVLTNVPSTKGGKRIVGKPGKSGRKPTSQGSAPATTDSANNPTATTPPVEQQTDDDDTAGDYTRQSDTDTAAEHWHDGEPHKPPAKASSKLQVVESVSKALAARSRMH